MSRIVQNFSARSLYIFPPPSSLHILSLFPLSLIRVQATDSRAIDAVRSILRAWRTLIDSAAGNRVSLTLRSILTSRQYMENASLFSPLHIFLLFFFFFYFFLLYHLLSLVLLTASEVALLDYADVVYNYY